MSEAIFTDALNAKGQLIESYLCDIEVTGDESDIYDYSELIFAFDSQTDQWKSGWWFDAIILIKMYS